MQKIPGKGDALTETAVVDPDVAVQLTFGNRALAESLIALQGLLGVLTQEVAVPRTRTWTIDPDDLANERSVAQIKIGLVRHVLGVRLREQLLDVVDAINRTRTLSLAQAVRAAMETAGAIVYYRKKFSGCRDDIAGLIKQLNRCLLGSRFDWNGWQSNYFSGSEQALAEFTRRVAKDKQVSEGAPPSVMTFIDYLQDRWSEQALSKGRPKTPLEGQVRVIYSQLCDFVHPSIGTWKTYVEVDESSFEVRVSSRSEMGSLRFLWLGFGQFVTELSFIAYADLVDLDGRAQ